MYTLIFGKFLALKYFIDGFLGTAYRTKDPEFGVVLLWMSGLRSTYSQEHLKIDYRYSDMIG